MRKNGVRREITPIEGGVCAPKGFRASGVACGVKPDGKRDFSLIVADRRYPCAAVFTQSSFRGAPVERSREHVKDGYAQAIVINSGIANVCASDGAHAADKTCLEIAKATGVNRSDVLIASTGKIMRSYPLKRFLDGIPSLVNGLGASDEHSRFAAEGILSDDVTVKSFAYEFYIGDVLCKLGGIAKGSRNVSPNMATTLIVLTTDVNISTDILQRAFAAEVKDSFNLLTIDGCSSANDTACIFSSCLAENAKIERVDTEYKKFADALHLVCVEVCKAIVSDGNGKLLEICVFGARSKTTARAVAKSVATSYPLKDGVKKGVVRISDIAHAVGDSGLPLSFKRAKILLKSDKNARCIMEDGEAITAETPIEADGNGEIVIEIYLQDGNYSSVAWSRKL